jgi:multidrug efflux pump subunit AcrA (membrane-fusion protein)
MKSAPFLALIMLALAACHSTPPEPPRPPVPVKVVPAVQADVRLLVRAPATIFPRQQANIAARLTAPVRHLRARKGDTVPAGELLAQLENADLLAQRAEAAAALADAQASLAKVSAGTLPTEIERARGQVATTEAALNQARQIYERRQQLFNQGAIPARDLLVSQTELATASTNHAVALKSLQLLENQSQERDLQIARSRVEQARARLAFIDAQLSYSQVRSPFAGTLTEQFLFPGDMAKPDTPIFTVADLSVAVARAQVPEASAAGIRPSEPCSFHPADRPQAPASGSVTVVNRAVDPSRRTVEVWCEIPNSPLSLRAGVFGSVTIVTGALDHAIVVPLAAVQFDEGSSTGAVMVVDATSTASRRQVDTAPAHDGRIALLRGVRPGETVIVEGGYGLPDGTRVKPEVLAQ